VVGQINAKADNVRSFLYSSGKGRNEYFHGGKIRHASIGFTPCPSAAHSRTQSSPVEKILH